jgi:hypothetical protein
MGNTNHRKGAPMNEPTRTPEDRVHIDPDRMSDPDYRAQTFRQLGLDGSAPSTNPRNGLQYLARAMVRAGEDLEHEADAAAPGRQTKDK